MSRVRRFVHIALAGLALGVVALIGANAASADGSTVVASQVTANDTSWS